MLVSFENGKRWIWMSSKNHGSKYVHMSGLLIQEVDSDFDTLSRRHIQGADFDFCVAEDHSGLDFSSLWQRLLILSIAEVKNKSSALAHTLQKWRSHGYKEVFMQRTQHYNFFSLCVFIVFIVFIVRFSFCSQIICHVKFIAAFGRYIGTSTRTGTCTCRKKTNLVCDEARVTALWRVDVDDALFLSSLGRSVTA